MDVLDLYSLVGDQFIMSQSGPTAINLVAVSYALENLYDSVDNKRYFIERLKILVSSYIEKSMEGTKDG